MREVALALTSKIISYNPSWPDMFATERDRIAGALGDEVITIHHVGSTAVPQLAAKPEIDILVEVTRLNDASETDPLVCVLGYVQGQDLSFGHRYYRRNAGGTRTHKVHLCETGHWQISRMLRFRDLLRDDADLRAQYQSLKLNLEAENTEGIVEYLARKAPFIDAIVGPKPSSAK